VDLESNPLVGIKEMSKSTGPRTPKGKARSSKNAAKHWIESGRILPEEEHDAAILRRGLEGDFKPQSLIEDEVIDDLVFNRLIKRRIDIAFMREFSKASIENTIKEMDHRERSSVQYWLRMAGLSDEYSTERERAEALNPDDCVTALKTLRGLIRERGIQPEDLQKLRELYGDQPTEYAAIAMYLLVPLATKKAEQDKTVETKDDAERKTDILEMLKTEIQEQERRQELAQRILEIECAPDLQEPPRHTLETLLRYRAANTRELNSLLDSLERIRRLRKNAA
jgi:hypothetical protein